MQITDSNGISILLAKPSQGQRCQTKIKGDHGYHENSVYNEGHFETYEDKDDRFVITQRKMNLWLPISDNMKLKKTVTDGFNAVEKNRMLKDMESVTFDNFEEFHVNHHK